MAQATSDETRNGYRIGTSRGEATVAAPPSPANRPKLPPIEWTHVDRGEILRQDLVGVSGAVVATVVGLTVLIASAMGTAIVLGLILNALGFDPAALY